MVVAVSACALPSGACSVQTLGAPKGDFVLYAVFDDVQAVQATRNRETSATTTFFTKETSDEGP